MTSTPRAYPSASVFRRKALPARTALAVLLALALLGACAPRSAPVEERAIGQRARVEQHAQRTHAPHTSETFRPAPSLDPDMTRGASVVAKARSVIGTPYRYGGSSPSSGFDCSGLVAWVYSTHDLDLPRTASELSRAGRPVPREQIRAGDLIVFDLGRDKPSLHVAIATDDNGFIHSPSSGGRVRQDSLSDPYWTGRVQAVRRVLD